VADPQTNSPPFDIAIIGAGPGGYVGALRAGQLGARVAVIEKDRVGGTCLQRGCIPTKTLLASAEMLHQMRRAGDYGLTTGELAFDWSAMMKRKQRVVGRLTRGVEVLLDRSRVTLVQGAATFEAPNRLRVEGPEPTVLEARHVIVATGSVPATVPGWPAGDGICTSDDVIGWKDLPARLLIVGGGVIGCEFACLLNELDVDVTLVEMLPECLPETDEELGAALRKTLAKRGVHCKVGTTVENLAADGDGYTATLSDGSTVAADRVLVAVGRRPNVDGLGLAAVGVQTGPRGIVVNEHGATSVENVWAVGDCIGGLQLAHKASEEAVCAVETILGRPRQASPLVPSCIYTFPEVASVGMTAQQARQAGRAISIGRFPFAASGKALARADTEGFVKVVRCRETDEILGVHLLGHNATELVAAAGAFIQQRATAHDLAHTVFAHPTLSEAIKEATEDALGAGLHVPPRRRITLQAP